MLVKDIKVPLNKKKRKSDNVVEKDTKMYQKMKNKSQLNIEKSIVKQKNWVVIIKRNYLDLENLVSFLRLCEMYKQI